MINEFIKNIIFRPSKKLDYTKFSCDIYKPYINHYSTMNEVKEIIVNRIVNELEEDIEKIKLDIKKEIKDKFN